MTLDVSASALQWTVTGYSVAFASLLLTGSALGERYGRRRMFTLGLALFGLGSIFAGTATGIEILVAARDVQGIGGALILPLGLTIVTAAFPPERHGAAIGILEGVSGLAVIAGPLAGGGLTSLFGWQSVFWVNVPIVAVGILFMRRIVDESFGTDDGFDFVGLALSIAAAGSTVWVLVQGNELGWSRPGVVVPALGAVVTAAAFVLWEQRTAHPMISPNMLAARNFRVGLGAAMLLSASLYGVVFFMAQFLQVSQGATPWGAALRLLPWTATLVLVAPLAGRLADRVGPRPMLAGGLALQAVGLAWLSVVADVGDGYLAMLGPLLVAGVGASAALPVSQLAVIEASAEADIGRAVGTNNMLQEIGGSVGVALAVASFALYGDVTNPAAFAEGFRAVLVVGACLAVVGTVVSMQLRPRGGARPGSTPQTPVAHTHGAASGGHATGETATLDGSPS